MQLRPGWLGLSLGWATDLVGWASSLVEWAFSLDWWDGILPHSIGLCPLSGPLPKKEKKIMVGQEGGRREEKPVTQRHLMVALSRERLSAL